jgi:hypothetical protein
VFRKNIILTNVVEERSIDPSDYRQTSSPPPPPPQDDDGESSKTTTITTTMTMTARRDLGQAMIPGSRLVKVEIEQSIHDKAISKLEL